MQENQNITINSENTTQNLDKNSKKEKKLKDKEARKSLLRARIFIILVR